MNVALIIDSGQHVPHFNISVKGCLYQKYLNM